MSFKVIPAQKMSTFDCMQFFRSIKLDTCAEVIRDKNLSGRELSTWKKEHFVQLGVPEGGFKWKQFAIEYNDVKKKGWKRKQIPIEEMDVDEVYEWFLSIALPIPAKHVLSKNIDGALFDSYCYDDFYQIDVPNTGFKFKQFDITFRDLKIAGFSRDRKSKLWEMTVEDVAQWFDNIVLNQVANNIRIQKIDGKMTIAYIYQDFYNLGVPSSGFKEKQFRIEFTKLKGRPILPTPPVTDYRKNLERTSRPTQKKTTTTATTTTATITTTTTTTTTTATTATTATTTITTTTTTTTATLENTPKIRSYYDLFQEIRYTDLTPDDIYTIFDDIKLADVGQKLKENKINGKAIGRFTENDYVDYGVPRGFKMKQVRITLDGFRQKSFVRRPKKEPEWAVPVTISSATTKTTTTTAKKMKKERRNTKTKKESKKKSSSGKCSLHEIRPLCPSDQNQNVPVCQSKSLNKAINFSKNHLRVLSRLNKKFGKNVENKIDESLIEWVKRLRPVHRCVPLIFKSIVEHGALMSLDFMNGLGHPERVAEEVNMHETIVALMKKKKGLDAHINKYVKLYVKQLYSKGSNVSRLSDDQTYLLLQDELNHDELFTIQSICQKLARAGKEISENNTGIGYEKDKLIGTNQHVFSIVGMHTGYYYGDVIILLKPEIMDHPDFSLTPVAGTAFVSGRQNTVRSWDSTKDGVTHFHQTKFHPAIQNYSRILAVDLAAREEKTKKIKEQNVRDLEMHCQVVDSHFIFEGHLPNLVPITFIDTVIMPANVWTNDIPKHTKMKLRKYLPDFEEKVLILGPNINQKTNNNAVNKMKPGHQQSIDFLRRFYLVNKPYNSKGFSLTIGTGSPYTQVHFPIMFEKNQQMRHLYFRAKGGEFFVIFANDHPDSKSEKEKKKIITIFVEGATNKKSYISNANPRLHETIMSKDQDERRKALVEQINFNRGCNLNDFISYHVWIDVKKKKISIEHSGSSGINNGIVLSCQIPKLKPYLFLSLSTIGKKQVAFDRISAS